MSEQSEPRVFEPGRYLTKVNGADYLEVKWRLVWLRNEHPDARIETQLYEHDGNQAVVKATVSLDSGALATGWGSESQSNFHNYIEKAETKAIGRALAALGFGTQFCPDFDYGAASGQVVDSPVQSPGPQGASFKQRGLIRALSQEAGLAGEALDQFCTARTGKRLDDLDRRAASVLIDALKDHAQTRQDASVTAQEPRRAPETPPSHPDMVTDPDALMKRLHAALAKHSITHQDIHDYYAAKGYRSTADVPTDGLARMADWAARSDSETVQGEFARVLTSTQAALTTAAPATVTGSAGDDIHTR